MKKDEFPILARDYAKKYDAQWDRVFATHLAKKICGIDSSIGAMYFPNTKMLVFHIKNLIIYKVILDEYNTTQVSIENHVKQVDKIVRMLKLGLLDWRDIRPAKVNWKLGRSL